jgi:hypothetical protein
MLANYARVLNGMARYQDALKSCDEAFFVQALVHRGNCFVRSQAVGADTGKL